MCMWFWGYRPFIFYYLFHRFDLVFFPGPIGIRIDILCAQLLLDFSTDHLETMHTWSEDVHVVLRLSCHFFFFQLFAFFQLSFFSCDVMTWVACGRNSSFSFIPNFLKLCRRFCHGLKTCMCFRGYSPIICYHICITSSSFFQVRLVS